MVTLCASDEREGSTRRRHGVCLTGRSGGRAGHAQKLFLVRAGRVAARSKIDSEVTQMALIRWSVLVAFAGLTFACSSNTQPGNTINAKTDTYVGAGGGGGLGGGSAASGPVMCFSNCNVGGAGNSTATGSGGIQQVCGGQAFKAEPAPVDMYI